MSSDHTSSPESAESSSAPRRSRVSVACFMCQRRKIKCEGTFPCANCRRRNWSCRFNIAADGRRTAATRQGLLQEITDTIAQVQHQQELIAGIVAVIRGGGEDTAHQLIHMIRTTDDLTQIASFVRHEVASDSTVQTAYHAIDFQSMQKESGQTVTERKPAGLLESTTSKDPRGRPYGQVDGKATKSLQ